MNVSRILKPTAPASGPKNDWIPPSSTTTSGSDGLFRDGEAGKDAAFEEREEPAGQAREEAGQDEREELVTADVHADEAGASRVFPDRPERVAEGRVDDRAQREHRQPGHREGEVAVGEGGLQRRRR